MLVDEDLVLLLLDFGEVVFDLDGDVLGSQLSGFLGLDMVDLADARDLGFGAAGRG